MIWLRKMEQGHGSSFILLEAHQKPIRISSCCAALYKTDVLEQKFKAGCRVPDPTRQPLLAGSSEQQASVPPFSRKTSQGGHVCLDVGQRAKTESGKLAQPAALSPGCHLRGCGWRGAQGG